MLQKPFKQAHKIDGKFGEPRSYGLHSGEDWNGVKGGNTDCGYKLYPIDLDNDSEIIHQSQSNTGYGNIVVYKIVGEWGERWIRYCHCQKILTSGVIGNQTPIALLGTTGNSTGCHLHWDVIKKPMRNWRTYAKTKDILNEYFEKPSAFFERWKNVQQEEDMPEYFKNLLHEYNLSLENESEIRSFFDKGRKYDDRTKELEEQVKSVNEALADRASEVSLLTEKLQKLTSRVEELEELYDQARSERDKATWENEKLSIYTRKLEEENAAFKEENDLMAYGWIDRLLSLFKKRG